MLNNLRIITFGFSYKFQRGPKVARGGRERRRFRYLFFRKPIANIPLIISHIGYDAFRTGFIFLGVYFNGLFSLDLAPVGLLNNQILIHGDPKFLQCGARLNLMAVPVGTVLYNVELRPGNGGQLMRAAGMYAILIAKQFHYNFGILRFRSGFRFKVCLDCCASIGRVSNIEFDTIFRGLAGFFRRLGKKPKVRGIAKNPIDHPNGGRTSGGKIFRNITGRILKNVKTTKFKKTFFSKNKHIRPLF